MKQLLIKFNYNNHVFAIWGNNKNIIINKINNTIINNDEVLLCLNVLKKVIDKQNIFYDTIRYKNDNLDVIYDSLNNKYKLKKNGIICDYYLYKPIYDLYNCPVYYNKLDDSNNNEKDNSINNISALELNRLETIKENRENNKKVKEILVTIAGVTITLTIFVSSMNLWLKDYSKSDGKVEITTTILETLEDDYSKKQESTTKLVKEMVKKPSSTTKVQEETTVYYNDTVKIIIQSLYSNPYISDYYKNIFVLNFGQYLNDQVIYMSPSAVQRICSELSTLRIIDNLSSPKKGVAAEYYHEENKMCLYKDLNHSIPHEFLHLLGTLSVYSVSTDYISEGYVEVHNPKRSIKAFPVQQNAYIILERIYGKKMMNEAFYNESLYDALIDRFDSDAMIHWNLIKDLNTYLSHIGFMSTQEVINNSKLLEETYQIIGRLKNEYELVTGKSWDDDEILLAIESLMTGENTLDLKYNENIIDVWLNGSDYSYQKSF